MNNRTQKNKKREFSGKAYAYTIHEKTGEKIILPLFDEMRIVKTERKKIQILLSGEYKKGVCNNEKSHLYQYAQKFFKKNGFSFGIEIHLTKNIPENSGFSEETEQQKILMNALENFSEKKNSRNMVHRVSTETDIFTEKRPSPNIEIILFPKYKIPENFLEQSINYRKISVQNFILESFFEVQKKFTVLEIQKKNPEISGVLDFGLIGNGANIWVLKSS